MAYLKKGECQKALADAEAGLRAATDSPQKSSLIAQKAVVLWEMCRLDAAIQWLEENRKALSAGGKLEEQLRSKYKQECGLEYGCETMQKIDRFICWLNESGARFNKIRMKYYGPDYRGVHAVKPIEAGEAFLWVPKKLIITSQMGKETDIGKAIVGSGVQLSWDYLVYITIYLLVQQYDPKSWWKPYMDVYPRTVDTFPMFYKEEEKALLKGSPMLDQVGADLKELHDEYDKIAAAVPEFKKFSFDDYARSKTLVVSRIFFVKVAGVTDHIMVPLAGLRTAA